MSCCTLSPGGELDKVFARGGAGRIRFLGRVLVNLSSCVALNRFQALESVASLEAKAQELMRHNNFLASKYPARNTLGQAQAPGRLPLCVGLPRRV